MVQSSTHYQIHISYILSIPIHLIKYTFLKIYLFLNNFIEDGMSFFVIHLLRT